MRHSPWQRITAVRHPCWNQHFLLFLTVVCKGFAQLISETVIVMYYPENSMKSGIKNCSQCLIITTSPEEHRRVKLAQRRNKPATSAILILKCLLFLSVFPIRLHIGKRGCCGNGSGAGNRSHLQCTWLWQGRPQTKPWKSAAFKLPISLIKCDIVFSQQSAHHCCTSHQLFLRLVQSLPIRCLPTPIFRRHHFWRRLGDGKKVLEERKGK